MYTIALSGPARARAQVEVALEAAGIPVYPEDHWAPMNWRAKFPDDGDEWITVRHADVNAPVAVVERFKWRLRVHYPEPAQPMPSAEQRIAATLDEMRAEIAALKARLP